MYICGSFMHTKVINNDGTAGNDVPMEKVSVHVEKKDGDCGQTPNYCKIEENWFAQPFTINEHLGVIDL